jgi:cephalosporin hydroxylase
MYNHEYVDRLLLKYRIRHIGNNDFLVNGMRVNRLFGLKKLIEENLSENSVVCEVGSYEGVSSELFANMCRLVFCVDTFCEVGYEEVFNNVSLHYPNMIKIKQTSADAAKMSSQFSFDFVYIDAGHTYEEVKADIESWLPRVKIGGYIGGHDYHNVDSGVIPAVADYFDPNQIKIYEDSSWIVKVI